MSAEKDVSRDVKKTGIIIGAVFCAGAFIYLLLSWMSTPPPAASRISVDKVAGGSGKNAPESARYRKLLHEDNEAGAQAAQAANSSFIASIGSGTVRQVPPISPEPAPPPAPRPAPAAQPAAAAQVAKVTIDPDRKKALEALLKELVAQRKAPAGQLASAAGMSNATGGSAGSVQPNPYASWTASVMPAVSQTDVPATTSGRRDRVLIPAGSRTGAVIDTAVDSDNTSSPVLAHVPAGPYAGATLMASGVQLAGDGVSVHFTSMSWNNNSWRIDAWAAMPDTLRPAVASSVNNRYVSRVLVPALANGLGLGGQLYANANTQILSNGYNTIEGRVGMPDGKAVAGTIIGGAAQQAGQVIASDAQKLPIKQVLVDRGQSIALLFMKAVKESDKETDTPPDSSTNLTSLPLQRPAALPPVTHP